MIENNNILRDIVPFEQFKNHEKYPLRSVIFGKIAGTKSNIPPWVFFMFFKYCKWYQIVQSITYVLSFPIWLTSW